jgi:hypothetical protein
MKVVLIEARGAVGELVTYSGRKLERTARTVCGESPIEASVPPAIPPAA